MEVHLDDWPGHPRRTKTKAQQTIRFMFISMVGSTNERLIFRFGGPQHAQA